MTVRVQTEDFDAGAEIGALSSAEPGAIPGAVVSFTGLVRDRHGGKIVHAMTLEHYPGMTEKELMRIRDEAMARWPITKATIIHRVGRLLAADQIVFVGCASPHRDAAFEAARFMMDFLKTDAPFWKAEETEDGTQWVDARDSDNAAAARWSKD
ncbi:MAG: molybdopterin synthase catalytic subunit MoaE [Alphaproteobacteria bacterium]|nr:molybdopterin synthase catalytic subunit MoaE [Alphaproteobacteria bacterium]